MSVFPEAFLSAISNSTECGWTPPWWVAIIFIALILGIPWLVFRTNFFGFAFLLFLAIVLARGVRVFLDKRALFLRCRQ